MKFQSDAPSKTGTKEIPLSTILHRPGPYHSQRTRGLLLFLSIGLVLGLLIVAAPRQVFSQGVQLVKVDVHVVASGYRVSKLTGQVVVNDKNERIGKIDDFVIGHDEGRSLFTVLEVGGFLGIGSRLVAVPYDSLTIEQKGSKIDKIALPGASKEQLEKLTEFRYGT
jgi:sporulation protein YlmC with PRC-barrel domain